jgi:beta-lactamase regulating signal transducer with metallopeptidase domain
MMALTLELALKASVVMAASGLLVLLLRHRASAAWRHAICLLAVSSLLALPLISAALPAWEIPIEVASAPAGTPSPNRADLYSPSASIVQSPLPASLTASAPSPEPIPARPFRWLLWLTVMYVAGVVMLLTNLVVERWSMRDLARKATPVTDPEWIALLRACEREMLVVRPVRLLRSLEQTMPMAVGIRPPAILIPSVADTWSDDRRRAVLLHEMAHVSRRDCLTQFLASVAAAVYWPHPGVWWLVRRVRVERELACDDRVLSIGTGPRAYAEHLLELAYALGGSRAPALAVSLARPQ